jgi:hypothetical protein
MGCNFFLPFNSRFLDVDGLELCENQPWMQCTKLECQGSGVGQMDAGAVGQSSRKWQTDGAVGGQQLL